MIYISRYPILRPGKIGFANKTSNHIFGNKKSQSKRIMKTIGYQLRDNKGQYCQTIKIPHDHICWAIFFI